MTDKQNRAYVPAIPDVPAISTRETPQGGRVVSATNETAPLSFVLFAFGALTLGAFIVGLGLQQLTGWPVAAVVLAMAPIVIWGGYRLLLILNGDHIAHVEIQETERTERQRIGAQRDAIEYHYGHLETAENNRHQEEMARIEADSRLHSIQQAQSEMLDAIRRLPDMLGTNALPAPAAPSFVPARTRPALQAVREYVLSLFDDDGSYDSAQVHASGHIARAVPWAKSGDWMRQAWGNDAAALLTDSHGGQPPLVEPVLVNGQPRGYRVRVEDYPDRRSVSAWLASIS